MSLIETVQTFDIQKVHVGRIGYQQDILSELEAYCQEHQIQSAWINILGALSEATLAYYRQDTHEYVTQVFKGEYEILNGTGNISLRNGLPVGHIHLTLSNTEFGCMGGHLMKDSVKVFACEFILYVLNGSAPLVRCEGDPNTGLPLWK